VPSKRHSRNSWRSTKELESPSRTWWRAKRGTWPSWRGLGLQWSGDRTWKERRRVEMTQRGPRMAPEKVRKKGLCYLPLVSIVVLFFL